MSSEVCFNLDQSKILLSGNGLKRKYFGCNNMPAYEDIYPTGICHHSASVLMLTAFPVAFPAVFCRQKRCDVHLATKCNVNSCRHSLQQLHSI